MGRLRLHDLASAVVVGSARLGAYGIRVGQIINQDDHDRYLRRVRSTKGRLPSKNPAAFGIDLHVDDSEGVSIEGERFNFRVVVVAPDEKDWAGKVMAAAEDAMRRATGIRP